MDRMVGIVQEMKKAKIVAATTTCLHVEFRSALSRFLDAVEFVPEDLATEHDKKEGDVARPVLRFIIFIIAGACRAKGTNRPRGIR